VTLRELQDALDVIGWEEFYAVRSYDDHPERNVGLTPSIGRRLESLAEGIDAKLVTELAHTPGYLVWALRLCPYVIDANCDALAYEFRDSTEYSVRYWARRLLRH
jgi:hypothetical protein